MTVAISSPSRRLLVALVVGALALGCAPADPPADGPDAEQPATKSSQEPALEGPVFVDLATESGVDFKHFNGMSGRFFTAEITAAGCGLLDYDNDGDLDLYLVQGRMLPPDLSLEEALYPPADGKPLTDRLYRNDSTVSADGKTELRFVDVTADSGIVADGYGMGVATGDIDNDGWIDIYVTNMEANQLWRNRGDGSFENATRGVLGDERWSVPAAFFDFDRDGLLDLYVGNYVDFDFDDPKACFRTTGARDYCGPLAYAEIGDRMLHNRGRGEFADVTHQLGMLTAFGSALGVVVADVDRDGWLDLYVANDGRPNQLWMNEQGSRFDNQALLRGSAVNAAGKAEASMGVVAGDFDNDGDDDLFMAHLLGETNTYFANDGAGMYDDMSIQAGLASASRWATAFGAVDLDIDNDGLLDLMTVNGEVRVIEEQVRDGLDFPLRQPNQLFWNRGDGRFEEVSELAGDAFSRLEVSRGAAVGDFDNDGDADVLVLNSNSHAELLINQIGQRQPWLGLRLVTATATANGQPARDALGARARVVRTDAPDLWRTSRTDGSFASARDPRVLFGLGSAPRVERVEVVWPSGKTEQWTDVALGTYTTLIEGSGAPIDAQDGG